MALPLPGGTALTTHAAKATTRLVVNASPEPVSNVAVSLAENGLVAGAVWLARAHPASQARNGVGPLVVAGAVWLARAHPLAGLVAGVVGLTAALPVVVWLGRRAARALGRLRRRLAGPPGGDRR